MLPEQREGGLGDVHDFANLISHDCTSRSYKQRGSKHCSKLKMSQVSVWQGICSYYCSGIRPVKIVVYLLPQQGTTPIRSATAIQPQRAMKICQEVWRARQSLVYLLSTTISILPQLAPNVSA